MQLFVDNFVINFSISFLIESDVEFILLVSRGAHFMIDVFLFLKRFGAYGNIVALITTLTILLL